jgi:hypothetical protein
LRTQLPEENIPLLENPQLPYLNEILPASVFIFTPYFAASSGLSFKSFLNSLQVTGFSRRGIFSSGNWVLKERYILFR